MESEISSEATILWDRMMSTSSSALTDTSIKIMQSLFLASSETSSIKHYKILFPKAEILELY